MSVSDHDIELLDSLPDGIGERMDRGHETYETEHGVVCDYRRFSLVLRDDGGEVIGVLTAYTAYAEIVVDDLWVDVAHRGQGHGRRLMHHLEDRFQGSGYNNINLMTSAFQAPGFYEKCGFEVEWVRVNPRHPRLTKTFFVKFFDEEEQNQGILDAAETSED